LKQCVALGKAYILVDDTAKIPKYRILGPSGLRGHLHYGSPVLGYILALVVTSLAGVMQLAVVQNAPFRAPFFLFYPAIAIASFLAGAGPGFLAVVLSGLFGFHFFAHMPGPVSWTFLAIVGPLVTIVFVEFRQLRENATASARELARFKFIGDHASDWIFLVGVSGEIQYANRTAATSLGWPESELIARDFATLVPGSQRSVIRDLLLNTRSEAVHSLEVGFERRNKSVILMELICTVVNTSDGQVIIHAAARDITERRQIEQKLRDMRHWESLGVMAGGMAHDFNNLLTSIIGNASLAKDMLPPESPAESMIAEVISAGERSADLVRLMLATSGHRNRENEVLDLSLMLNWILSSRSLPQRVRISPRVEPVLFTADRRSIQTLLWSLISNAAESYGGEPGEVIVTIHSGNTPVVGPPDFEDGHAPAGECVTIVVEDRGSGMQPEVLERAFDPFFSTRFTGRGLGLPAVRGIVRAYSGKLRLYTSPGVGTRVEVVLPDKNTN
jgi:PAS domain S-box-containing protein